VAAAVADVVAVGCCWLLAVAMMNAGAGVSVAVAGCWLLLLGSLGWPLLLLLLWGLRFLKSEFFTIAI
jgi:hypothetical protein